MDVCDETADVQPPASSETQEQTGSGESVGVPKCLEADVLSGLMLENALVAKTSSGHGARREQDREDDDEFQCRESSYLDRDFSFRELDANDGELNNGDDSIDEDDGSSDVDEDDDDEDEDDAGRWSTDDEVPPDEIDALLDEKYDEYSKGAKRARLDSADEGDMAHEQRDKVVLKVRGRDHFEILPEAWVEVTHNSGMPVYLHKQSRVCTLSKPYFLGPGSARKHDVPLSAIPCLHYRREVEKEAAKIRLEAQQTDISAPPVATTQSEESADCASDAAETRIQGLPTAKVETLQEYTEEKSIGALELREYCRKLFEFQTITVRRFKTWAGRRRHQKHQKQKRRPTLPVGTKLITCPLPPSSEKDGSAVNSRREFIMNPSGKSYVCILHEYVQHAMRCQPRYVFKELENSSAPYGATVLINDMMYGAGFGCSKKIAKTEAAKATLEILIPQMKTITSEDKHLADEQQDLSFFDSIRVKDPRVSELCAKAGQSSPYQLLLECLKRNYGMGDTQIKLDMHMLRHQKNEFTMVVGKHVATVVCKNKRDGKQRASQAILQALHSHINSWGSLLRLYGKGSCKTLKEKKLEEQQITELQSRTTANKPNLSILSKLKEEMLKLKEKRALTKFDGTVQSPDVLSLPSTSSSLKNLDL